MQVVTTAPVSLWFQEAGDEMMMMMSATRKESGMGTHTGWEADSYLGLLETMIIFIVTLHLKGRRRRKNNKSGANKNGTAARLHHSNIKQTLPPAVRAN